MLLQEVVRQLDAELARLTSIRAIVADLGRTPVRDLGHEIEELLHTQPEPTSGTEPQPLRRRRVLRRLGNERITRQRRRRIAVEPSALTAAIPSGPVVVSAEKLAREREARLAEKPAETSQTSDSSAVDLPPIPESGIDPMVRDLTQRWLA